MDSRNAIVNNKQTSNKQCLRPICLLGLIYLLTAAAVTVALTMIIGIANGREGAGGQKSLGLGGADHLSTRTAKFQQPSSNTPMVQTAQCLCEAGHIDVTGIVAQSNS
jgi:hypothetical protein